MVTAYCSNDKCEKLFYASQYSLDMGWAMYCSRACLYAYARDPKIIAQRFLSYVSIGKLNHCWPWTGYTNSDGYGVFSCRTLEGPSNKKTYGAHKFAYMLMIGDVPDGLFVCHTCDNPPCCNWRHLWLGTAQDNMDDMVRKGRSALHAGETNGRAILSPDDILEIRELYVNWMSQRDIARKFGVSRSCIIHIVNRTSWNHI